MDRNKLAHDMVFGKEKEESSLAGHLQRHPASDGWERHAVCVTEIDLDMIRKLMK
jgi:hypothetical protein